MDVTALRSASHAAVDVLAGHVASITAGEGPATARRRPDAVAADLDLHGLLRHGGLDPENFRAWLATYLDNGVHLHHPGYMAHQVGAPDVGAALADLVHGVVNQPMSIYEMGSGAALVERVVVGWMVEHVGWDARRSDGVLTHGGSLANVTALLAARAHAAPDAWTAGAPRDLALLAPPGAHYSVERAAGMLGLGTDAIVELEVDELQRIRVDRLDDALERVRAGGRRPMALVAAACATTTGLHDDLRAVGDFCRAHGIWFHVDGAHGASALLSDELRDLLDGIELADSVIWDAHKMLRTSALCAAVLVRRGDDLRRAFQQHATYLDFDNPDGVDTLDRQLETTKAELGLKVFLNLAFTGERGLAAYVEDQYAKTRRLYDLVQERPGFHAPYEPESNILCFRHGAAGPEQDAIREALLESGEFHLSAAEIDGGRHLRVSVMSPNTTEATFARLLDAIERVAAQDLAA
jgi:L-2,4-diaminobutyrate decarboxylase